MRLASSSRPNMGALTRHFRSGRRVPSPRLVSGIACLLASALALDGCTVGPDYRRPQYPTPATFRGEAGPEGAPSVADLGWWRVFEDETLQQLIRTSLQANYNLSIAT